MDTQISTSAVSTAIPEMGQRAAARPAEARTTQTSPEPAKPAKPDRPEPSREALELAANRVQKFVEASASELQFSVDETSGARVVRVFDKSTKELIRQIPSQDMLDMAAAIDQLQGLLLKQKA